MLIPQHGESCRHTAQCHQRSVGLITAPAPASTPAGGYKASWKRQGLNHCSSALKRPEGRDFQEGSTALHCFLRQTAPVKSCCLIPPPVRALFGRVVSPQLARSCILGQNEASLTATQAVLRPSIVPHLGKGALVILTSESLLFAI